MNKPPLVSIVIPTYNAERFLAETIRSALHQTYRDIEVIVADDGSTDGTKGVVADFIKKDPRVKYVYQKNAGQSAARNAAIAAAKGKYVAFLDSDDLFLPEKIETQVGYLEANPDCGVSYSKIYHFFDGRKEKLYYFSVPHPSGYLFPALLKSNFINPLAVMLRKSLLDRYGGFEPSFRRVDEQYLWLKLSFHGVKFCYLEKALGHYRIHRKSLSNEAAYFKETEERFLELLRTIRSWMTKEEIKRYDFERMLKKTKRRLLVGRVMAGKNPFAKLLLSIYNARRNKRLRSVS